METLKHYDDTQELVVDYCWIYSRTNNSLGEEPSIVDLLELREVVAVMEIHLDIMRRTIVHYSKNKKKYSVT